MYTKIMVPVDLEHESTLEKAIKVAADIGKLYSASVCLVGVSASPPSEAAHNEDEYKEKLAQYAEKQSAEHGIQFDHKTVHSNDPAVELDDALADTGEAMGADLVVMASHVPRFMDHFFKSNASRLVAHTSISVVIVR
ncbi:universal stress protein [Kangiella shandongensis]|uniref:universal stress protein n=1 Tax=Kangiella shandongensis TaxID=2763258 RepID=UPI001CBD431B|nr:universal stress protein [Kangiella shandongensis]